MSLIPLGFWKTSKPPIPTSGLRLYYNFEGGGYSGSTVTDLAGVGNGTLSGITYNSGNGGYMNFDGSNDFINTNRSSVNEGIYYGNWTIVYAVRFPNVTGTKYVFGSSNAAGYQENAHSGAVDDDIVYTHNSGGEPKYLNISANQWYHVACSYVFNTYLAKIYINGTVQVNNGFQERMIASYTIYLGRVNTTYYPFDLGLAMIYNRALTDQEISDIYNNQRSRFGI
jgi:hypothetical protein